jgi:hypothetical protein
MTPRTAGSAEGAAADVADCDEPVYLLPALDINPQEYARRQVAAATAIAARFADMAERLEVLAMLGLAPVGIRAA